jgi:methyltransferase (TIGR00027 family)
MNGPIRNISDTALWVAMYRALESERPDALFQDPFARKMAGERGAAILRSLPRGRALAWPMVVRTAVMDEIIVRCVREGAKTVVNLAAGLDARAFRLELPRSLRWFDVDLPDMIQYRREHLDGAKSSCVHEHLAADLSDAAERGRVFGRVAAGSGPALVITEGLLIYLTDEQAGALAQNLHQHRELRWWLIDLASPQLLQRMSKTWQPHLAAGNAPMQFAPANGTAFFAPFGWRETEFRSTWDESLRLGRSVPLAKMWNLLLKLRSRALRESARRMSAIVLLERDPANEPKK